MTVSLGELAIRFGCTLKGDPDVRVSHVASLESAGPDALTFLANPRYRKFLGETRAGAVVLEPKFADECRAPALLSKNPYASYARIAAVLHPPPPVAAGRHASAVIDATAQIDPTAAIGPLAVIGADVRIGPRVLVGPGCVIMDGACINADTRLAANVTLCAGVTIGERCILHPGVVIGGDGFGIAPDQGEWVKIPQIGSVRVGNDVEIGANTTVDRGAIGDTVLGDGVKLDNQIQIAHNVIVGEHTAIAAMSGISGSTTVGKRCMFGGQVGVAGHLTICDDVVLMGRSFASGNITRPGYYASGITVDEASRFRKNAARFHQLDQLFREVRRRRGAPADEHEDKDAQE
jgi:UDP-3-O-[3-hydroxymyristoyl] glucosamine N-acyltransferase